MAYNTIGNFMRRSYSASNHSSTTAAVVTVGCRAKLDTVYHTPKVAQTAAAGSFTVSLNNSQVTGLSSVAVTPCAVGQSTSVISASPSSPTYLAKGDVLSVVGSSVTASNWTFHVREF